jgi:major type 1 subunit fimbrin (pilin)
MRITPGAGCIVAPGSSAQVTFTAAYGGTGAGGALYALESGGANDLALTIKDNAGKPVDNATASKDYPLDATNPTTMIFSAAYKSIGTAVTAGAANTDVQFSVDIP